MVHHSESNEGPEVKPLSQSAATTPAIVGICLGATLFLVGIVAVTLFFYRRKSFVRRKSGVYLTRRSPHSEQIPLQSQLVVHRRSDTSPSSIKSQHLVMSMKKSPSPPIHYTSPKNLSPLSPPSEDRDRDRDRERERERDTLGQPGMGSPTGSGRFSTTAEIHQKSMNRSSPYRKEGGGGISTTVNPSAPSLNLQLQSPHTQHQTKPLSLNSTPQRRDPSLSPRASPQISPSSESSLHLNETISMNLRNGNSMSGSNTDLSNASPTSSISSRTTTLSNSNSNTNNTSTVTTHILTGGGENLLGVLQFRIRYKTEKGALIVTVVKCEDLPVKDTTLMTCDPYVKLQLLPEKQQRVKTRVLRHTRQPLYDEDFTFYGIQPNQLPGITLHFVVLSFDRYSRDDVIGEVFCPLSSIELPETDNHQLEISRDIQPRNLKMRSQGRGEVLVSLCWQPTANRLTVVVLKARNLPKMDVTGLADPYVKMYLLYDGTRISKKKTHIKKRTLNPVFNESFVFDLPPGTGQGNHLDKVSLQLLLLDWDRVTKNEVIGRLELGNGATSGTATHHWTEVLNCPRRQIAEWHKLRD